jgi:hypothetical protein
MKVIQHIVKTAFVQTVLVCLQIVVRDPGDPRSYYSFLESRKKRPQS